MLVKLLSLSALLLTFASASPAPHKRSVEVVENCLVSGQSAITFDDGPYIYEESIAATLDAAGAKGTFFLNGANYDCIYDHADSIKALYNGGHTLGSHGWSHPDFTSLSWDQIHDELYKVEQAFIKILGVKPLFFRPPYGNYNDLVLSALDNRGYKKVFIWNQDPGDANGVSVEDQKKMYDGIPSQFPTPQLILQHSTQESTANEVLPYAISTLQGAGYKLVAVDTCLGSDGMWPYEWVGEPQARDETWVC